MLRGQVRRPSLSTPPLTFLIVQSNPKWHQILVSQLVTEREDVLQGHFTFRNRDLPHAIPKRGQSAQVGHQPALALFIGYSVQGDGDVNLNWVLARHSQRRCPMSSTDLAPSRSLPLTEVLPQARTFAAYLPPTRRPA